MGEYYTVRGPGVVNLCRLRTKPVAIVLSVVVVLALIVAGGYLASRQLYFIGTNSQGIVTIYRGFPYQLPFGINLYVPDIGSPWGGRGMSGQGVAYGPEGMDSYLTTKSVFLPPG